MSTKQIRSNTKKHIVRRYPARTYRRKMKLHNDVPEIIFRDIDKADAKKEIQDYINKHPEGSRTSKIIETLRIDPLLTSNILEEMKQEGSALSRPIE